METNFITLIDPESVRTADGLSVRFFFWSDWLLRLPSDSGPAFTMERAFIEPSRPYSILPYGFAQRHDLRLLPVPAREFGAPPQARALGLADATARAVVLRFKSPQWNHPVLGADFLLEHRLRLFVDYARLEYAPIRLPDTVEMSPSRGKTVRGVGRKGKS